MTAPPDPLVSAIGRRDSVLPQPVAPAAGKVRRLVVVVTALCAAALALVGGCALPEGDPGVSPPALAPGAKADIYGVDDRRELYEASAAHRRVARSTALVVDRSGLEAGPLGLAPRTWSQKEAATLGGPLCEDEPFRDQPAPGFCSAFLIAPDLVATAGHCINVAHPCGQTHFAFGFGYERAGDPNVRRLDPDDLYRCRSVIGHRYDADAVSREDLVSGRLWSDWAVVRLDRPVVGREPLLLRRAGEVASGARVFAIGHPGGIPTKVTRGEVVDASPELYFNTDLDIYGGNSGSLVVGFEGLVEGIVSRGTGARSFHRDGGCFRSDLCVEYDADRSSGCSGNHIMRIEPVLQFVDATRIATEIVVARLGDAPIPDGGAYTAELTVDDPGALRFVTVNVGVATAQPSDLRITLQHVESGRSDVLFDRPRLQPAGEPIFSRTSDAFDGLPAAGRWRLRVEDRAAGNARSQWLNFFELHVGIGEPVTPSSTATFIGSACEDAADCTFDPSARCHRWSAGGAEHGQCTLDCDGGCPDRPGFATTFCVPDDGAGRCAPMAHALNAQCGGLPGATAQTVTRHDTDDPAPPSRTVCLPE